MRRRGLGRVGRPSLVGTAARTAVIAGTATAVSGKVAAAQQAKMQPPPVAPQAAPPPPAAPAPPPPSSPGLTDEVITQLKQLAELRDAGVLTEEEFSAKKTKLLGL